MKQRQANWWTFLLALMLAAAPAQAADKDALADILLARSDDVIRQLTVLDRAKRLTGLTALEIVREEMAPLLNFPKFAQRAMGKHWRKTSIEDQEKITNAFRALLENTYAKVLAQYSGQKTTLVSSKELPEDEVSVILQVQGGGKSTNIEYIFSPEDGSHLVSDIRIEGISLVANYRRQFSSIISKQGTDALAKRLEHMAAIKIQ